MRRAPLDTAVETYQREPWFVVRGSWFANRGSWFEPSGVEPGDIEPGDQCDFTWGVIILLPRNFHVT